MEEKELNKIQSFIVNIFMALFKPIMYLIFKLDPGLSKAFKERDKAIKDMNDFHEQLREKRKGTDLDFDKLTKDLERL